MPIHLPTILIIIGLALFFGLLLYSLIRDKKKGKSCCGGCAGCAMSCPNRADTCHPDAVADEGTDSSPAQKTDPEKE